MVEHVSPILDYASPGSKRKLRLPSRSTLTVQSDERGIMVNETLEAKGEGWFGVFFGIGMLVYLAVFMLFVRNTWMVILPVWIIELALLLRVIYDTWHRTRLEVVVGSDVYLGFFAVFRKREYRWPVPEIRSAVVQITDGRAALGVLMLDMGGRQVELFGGHDVGKLDRIVTEIGRVAASS